MINIPKHIAIIPDGNRRWAKKKHLPTQFGHRQGAKTLEGVLKKAADLKIPYITFWGSSWDNLTRRSKSEIDFLFKLFAEQFKKIALDKRVRENGIKVNVLGRWRELLPESTKKEIEKSIESTKHNKKYFLTFLLAYNGTDEMINCAQKIVNSARGKSVQVTENTIKENLWTKDLPPVDLVIRTGCDGDPHLSAGFMMWDTAYSQLYFTKTFFPAFSPKEFEKVIKDFSNRERRIGA